MHEAGIAARVIAVVNQARARAGAVKVLRVDLRVGDLVFVDVSQFCSAYHMLTAGTALAGSELEVERVPGKVRCPGCGWERDISTDGGIPSGPLFVCHACGADVDVIDGRQCEVVGMCVQ